ncbi:MAG: DUF5696 domain-containing protein [Clostridiales bacterium]|nr:DUF5696 domain-containing protein [Clostridiales bacterium]
MKKKSTAKKVILSCIVVALVLGLSYLAYYLVNYTFNKDYKNYILPIEYAEGSKFSPKQDANRPEELAEGFVLAEENDLLKLYYNETTTEVAVYEKNTGKFTYSNPQNLGPEDYMSPAYFEEMSSQIIIYYYNKKGDTKKNKMNTYVNCVNIENDGTVEKEKQYTVEKIPNGIRVLYNIGDLSSETGIVPKFISEDTLKTVLDKLAKIDEEQNTKHVKNIKNVYVESKTKKGFYQLNDGVNKRRLELMQESFLLIDWTEDDFKREMDAANAEYSLPVSFEIPLEYTLDNDKLNVSIATDHIKENGGGSIISMDLLPYFGATYYASEGDNYIGYFTDLSNTELLVNIPEYKNDKLVINGTGEDFTCTISNDIIGKYDSADFELLAPSNKPATEAAPAEGEDAENKDEGTNEEEKEDNNDLREGYETVSSWNSSEESPALKLVPGTKYKLVADIKTGDNTVTKSFQVVIRKEMIGADGYFLVPNGSGSLINLNSINCDSYSDYTERIYGVDDVMFDTDQRIQEVVTSKLPVFGLSTDTTDRLCIIARGESLAEVHVQTANDVTCKTGTSLTNYNTAYCKYYLRVENEVAMSAADKFIVWSDDLFKTQIIQKYCFLSDDNKGYSGMANYYRDYLASNNLLAQNAVKAESIGLYLDIIGSVKGDATLLGFNYETVIPATSFKQATSIVDSFYKNNINNLVINYQGWMNDGYYHETPDNISIVRKLGSKSGYNKFVKYVTEKGGKVYGDMAIVNVSFAAEEFQYNQESSRTFGTGYVAAYGKTGPSTYSNSASLGYHANLYDVCSPKFLMKYIKGSVEEMKKFDSGISYRDLGNVLYSDMKKTNIINREQAKEIVTAGLEIAKKSGKNIMLNEANAYALAYADDIINVPLGDNNYIYVDCEVPFYQMVIHGSINYASSPINLSADTSTIDNILNCIEYGAAPHFTLSYEPSTALKHTALNNLYATNYVNWVDEATTIYNDVNSVLSKVTDAKIVKHEILDKYNKVKKITYDNGVVIYVNYSEDSFKLDNGSELKAKSYSVGN